jgi:hypothetical protein
MTAGRGRRIENAEARDVRQVIGRFHVQECGILCFDLL